MTTDRVPKSTQNQQRSTQVEEQQIEVEAPAPFHVERVGMIGLQQTVGNQAVQRLIGDRRLARNPALRPRHFNGLPPVRGVTRISTTEPETEPEELPAEPEQKLLASDDGTLGEPPPDSKPVIQSAANPPGIQRGFFSSIGSGLRSIGSAIGRGARAVGGFVGDMALSVIKRTLQAAGVPVGTIFGFLKKAGGMFMDIIKNPGPFLGNLISGVKQGFSNFSSNILNHLKGGLMGWLFGTIAKAGLQIPKDFSIKGILTLIMQILGLTADALKQRLAKLIGEKNMDRIQKGWEMLSAFISNGVGGLWEAAKEHLGNLKEMVIDGVKDWVIGEVVSKAVIKVMSMFNPASGLVSAAMMIYNVIKFFIQRASQISALFKAVTGSVAAIAAGNVGEMAQKIEQTLAKAIPVVIGFLASLLGISGIANKIREIIQKVQKKIQDAIDAVLKRIANAVKKLFGKVTGRGDDKSQQTSSGSDRQKQIDEGKVALIQQQQNFVKDGAITEKDARKVAVIVKEKYPIFTSLEIKAGETTWDYEYQVQRATITGALQAGKEVKINLEHIFHGEINSRGNPVGFHHRASIGHEGKARIVPGSEGSQSAQGAYQASVQIFDEATQTWKDKGKSTFFPDSWSRNQVIQEIRGAYKNQTSSSGNRWDGISPSGLKIGGYMLGDVINTAFPVI